MVANSKQSKQVTETEAAKEVKAAEEPKAAAAKAEPTKAEPKAAEPKKQATRSRAAAKTEPATAAAKVEPVATKKTESKGAEKAEPTKKAEPKVAAATTKKAAAAKAEPSKKTVAAKAEPAKAETAVAKKEEPAKRTAAAKKADPVKKAESVKKAEPAKAASKLAKKTEPAKTEEPKAEAKTASAAKKSTAKKTTSTAAKKPATRKAAAKKAAAPDQQKPATEVEEQGKTPAADQVKEEVEVKVAPVAELVPEPEPVPVTEPAPEPEPAPEAAPEPEPAPAPEPAPEPEPAPTPEPVSEFANVGGVLIAAAECAPLVKVGGLADVVGALPKYLKKLGIEARIIMPFHRQIKEKYFNDVQHLCDFRASLGWRSQYVGVEKLVLDDVVYYFIDNEFYFGGPIYCGGEFEGEQYAFFTRAVMDCIPQLDFDVRILHCNDWHTAMMPLLAKTQYQGGMQAGLRTIQTIHNLHFQGQFSHEFDRDLLRVDDSLATPQFIEHYGCDNMLKAGIVFADKVTTVSPTYSQEICGPDLGESLDGVLRSRGGDLWGILNGIDVDVWNPQTDPHLTMNYSAKSQWRKSKNRDALLEELGLMPAGPDTPVLAMVGRLTPQKGIDLVKWVFDEIMAEDIRVIMLGSGDADFEDFFRDAENRYKGRLCSYIGYNGDLSHRIYAGSDLFLMPSLFEPCGISQMIAMRYGTLPIVRETGGLRDTVVPYNQYTGEGNGFSFANYEAYEMLSCIRYAIGTWRNPEVRKSLIEHAMETDFSFDRCARAYAELYRTLS